MTKKEKVNFACIKSSLRSILNTFEWYIDDFDIPEESDLKKIYRDLAETVEKIKI